MAESVEVWMWVIAGIMLGSIIFVTSYTMIARYTHNNEVATAQSNMNILKSSIERVCFSGFNSQEIKELVFPYITRKIFVKDEKDIETQGYNLCIDIEGEGASCAKMSVCEMSMPSLTFDTETNVFYLVEKALGRKKPANIRFVITKTDQDKVAIEWKKTFIE